MKIDYLVAEIGSTTTVVNGFADIYTSHPKFIAQGQAPTTVLDGDVNIGLNNALEDLKASLGIERLSYEKLLATSSAAGGLKMTVHGLVYDMTVKAAKEAALGAGANLHMVTSGRLMRTDIKKIKDIQPNIILIAGGVNYGERQTAIYNAEVIAGLDIEVPVIYAGNVENQDEIRLIFEEANKEEYLYIVENVYPKIDELNVEPTRKIIHDVFEKHIIHAPGMEHVKETVNGKIVPTPGAVMESSKLIKDEIGDVMTIDVGGATTDVHSVTEGSDEISRILISPEPEAKRTVEGDLGVFVNMQNIVELIGREAFLESKHITEDNINELIENHQPIPTNAAQVEFVEILTEKAVLTSTHRHAGGFRNLFSSGGKSRLAEGKDLTSIKYIIGTGGALTRLPNRIEILNEIAKSNPGNKLLPNKEAQLLIDNDYIMASLGVLAKENKDAALRLLKKSLKI